MYGAQGGTAEVRLDLIDYAQATVASLPGNWSTLIPDTVFELSLLDPANPPAYLARCALQTETDLATISLVAPPPELVACLKQDLSEFLVSNSLHHQLGNETVPVHVVQGTADSLVPYQQAIGLCSAIDGSTLPTEIVEPLTTYNCGASSKIQLVQGAEHALELGMCFDSLCPAGSPGTATRDAALTAVHEGLSSSRPRRRLHPSPRQCSASVT